MAQGQERRIRVASLSRFAELDLPHIILYMYIRKLEQGECQEHRHCWTAALMECDYCRREYVVHRVLQRVKQSYCSVDCRQKGNELAIAKAIEGRKRFVRIKYGSPLRNTTTQTQ